MRGRRRFSPQVALDADGVHVTSRMPSSRAPSPTGRGANGCPGILAAMARHAGDGQAQGCAEHEELRERLAHAGPARPGRGPSLSGPRKKNCQPRMNTIHRPTGARVTARVT